MSYNGSGTFLINSAGQPVVANTVISATVFNALTSDLATGLSTAITKDGQTTITNNIPFGSNKITGLGSGTAAADAANLGQVQSTVAKLITVTGTDTITGSMSPQLTAYAAGQLFYFVANAANTGAVTLNIDSLGAKSITRDGSSALAAGDINSGEVVVVIYDGTRFQMINAANSFGNTTINGTLTVTGNAGFQANVSITSALSVGGVFAVTGAATFTANPTLSGGTANGVLYLNGSKVATSGSALYFDGTGKLGVGTTTPVSGVSAGFEAVGEIWATTASSNSNQIRLSPATSGANIIYSTYSGSGSYLPLAFNVSGSEQMRLTSTGLGIGTASPSQKLSVNSGASTTVAGFTSTGSSAYLGLSNSSASIFLGNDSTSGSFIVQTPSGSFSTKLTLDNSGNLGLGVTPGTWTLSGSSAMQIKNAGWMGYLNNSYFTANASNAAGTWKYIASAAATLYEQNGGTHAWSYAASGTAGNTATFTQAMTLDASGNLLVGATTNSLNARLKVAGAARTCTFFDLAAPAGENWVIDSTNTTGSTDVLGIYASGATGLYIKDTGDVGIGTTSPLQKLDVRGNLARVAPSTGTEQAAWVASNTGGEFYVGIDNSTGTNFNTATAYAGVIWRGGAYPICFVNNATERGRFTAGGYFKASNDGTYQGSTSSYHEFRSTNNSYAVYITNNNASPLGTVIEYNNASPNGTGNVFLYCGDSTALRAEIRSNGGIANYSANNVALSDARIKNSITPAASMWDKVAALEIVAYKYNDQTHDDVNLGVIAQQVEAVEPVWVDADGFGKTPEGEEPLKTVYTTDITFAAIKALQEAMARIEQLEAKVAVLENK